MRLRAILPVVLLSLTAALADPPAGPDEGIRPVGADGKPLNLDFETGTLKDWTAEGDAFVGQPIKGDTVHPRRADMASQHQGQYWIGTYERAGDKPQGTLTSVPFKVTHPWASFLVGGGPWPETCVEIVRKDSGQVVSRTSGLEEENLRRVAVDLTPHLGQAIFIRIVDKHSGHWGHVNFDDFRFHASKPNFPERKAPQAPPPPDQYKFAGLTPDKAAQAMTVPEGFTVTLFAGEPDVMQPIGFCLDDRGRLWVAEAYIYPRRHPFPGPVLPDPEKARGDRIVILEDTDGDGKFDKRTVFMEGLNLVSGIEYGFGGLWVGAAPYLLFIPIAEGQDKPAGPPKILLDGWAYQDTHETLNTFTWGPGGWLYGCHGVFTHSRVGKPGTPDDQRVPINAGVWRYHPTRHVFEVFAHGTSNPWGLDFDEHGQAFVEACVIPHCFHIIQGGRYLRQAGSHFNPYTYADINTIADHFHYVGSNPHGGNNRSDSAGGGHAHCGLMCYLGGTWPEEYRGKLFMGNIHGRRLNVDVPRPKGSGFVAGHGPDFLLANDAWARFINMRYGPDGNVYLLDWYDKQACHHTDPNIWDRTNGRIYKISYRGSKPVTGVDLAKKTDEELANLQASPNDWYVRHARRLLQERGAKPQAALEKLAFKHPQDTVRLRGYWGLHVCDLLTEQARLIAAEDRSPYVRGWIIQLTGENQEGAVLATKWLAALAKSDPSPIVRLYIASALQRLPLEQRWPILEALLAHGEDAGDHNLPLMYWYAAEPLGGAEPARALDLAAKAKLPPIYEFMIRRIATGGAAEALALLVDHLGKADAVAAQRAVLSGVNLALKGRRQVPMPAAWPAVYGKLKDSPDPAVRNQAQALGVTFGDAQAFAELRRVLAVPTNDPAARQQALEALVLARDAEVVPVLQQLLGDKVVRAAAIKGLAAFDHAGTPSAVLGVYPELAPAEKRDAVNTLAARPAYGKALLDAVAAKKLPAADVPADVIRQLRNLHDSELDRRIAEVWGVVRETPADRARMMKQYKQLVMGAGPQPDVHLGRALFARTCQQCHVLFGTGGKVGPEITGANRANLDYLLENILDPSAVIAKEYAVTLLQLTSGRVITGIVKDETKDTVTVVTANEVLTLAKGDIEERKLTAQSLMPEDQLKPFSNHEVRSLIAYLQSPAQVLLLATAENAKDLFNGKDLTGWDGDPQLWKVDNGEIVGTSPGLKHNSFLRSQMIAADFRLTVQVKLVPNKENSGIQFRSEALPHYEVKGYQADVGAGWWGKLYEENGRGLLWDRPGDPHVKVDDWNEYVIEAVGSKIKTWINGKPCVDKDDPDGARRGIFAFQIHSGGPFEVRFKGLKLEVLGQK